MRQLRVWGSSYGWERQLVAAYTQKQAIEISGVGYRWFKDYWSETGNDFELRLAKKVGVWKADTRANGYYRPPEQLKYEELITV